ncbi:hypothetical protein Tco_1454239 [Tanacetum coccineum]
MSIMTDAAGALSGSASHPRPSSSPTPSFRDLFRDAIHRDFFPFSPGPYYALYPEGGVAGFCEFSHEEWDAPYQSTLSVLTKEVFKDPVVCKTIVNQFLTPGEMVWIKALSNDQLTTKMSVLHYLMMSHGGELLAQYRGLLQSHHDLKKQVTELNDRLSSSDVAFVKAKPKRKDRKKKIKSLSKKLDTLTAEVAHLSASLNQATILEVERYAEILRLKASPSEFTSLFQGGFQSLVRKFLASDEFIIVQGDHLSLVVSAGFERGLSMHQTQEEFAIVLNKISQFLLDAQGRLAEASPLVAQTDYPGQISDHATDPLSAILQLEPKKLARPGGVSASKDTYHEIVDGAGNDKLENVFVHGISHTVGDDVGLSLDGSERVSFGPNDVVVALSIGEKDNGSLHSSSVAAGEQAVAAPSGI